MFFIAFFYLQWGDVWEELFFHTRWEQFFHLEDVNQCWEPRTPSTLFVAMVREINLDFADLQHAPQEERSTSCSSVLIFILTNF